jgi:hypothetical protein
VLLQLRQDGVLDDVTKIQALLGVAAKYVIADAGWNLFDFATQMRSLTSAHLTFYTLPISGYETIDGQDANAVNPAAIKTIVHDAFYPPASSGRPHRVASGASALSTGPTPSPTPSSVIPAGGPQGGSVSGVHGIPCVN